MTIILAIPANNGIVLASDEQVTYANGIWATGKKILPLGESCVWVASGRGALIQRVQERLKKECQVTQTLEEMRDRIARLVRGCVQELFQLDQQPSQDSFVFVAYSSKKLRILQVAVMGTPEWVTTGPFALGIGRQFAHAILQPYTALIPDPIDVAKAALLAYKVIEEAIQLGA